MRWGGVLFPPLIPCTRFPPQVDAAPAHHYSACVCSSIFFRNALSLVLEEWRVNIQLLHWLERLSIISDLGLAPLPLPASFPRAMGSLHMKSQRYLMTHCQVAPRHIADSPYISSFAHWERCLREYY